jgi:hypothetical protein
MQDEETEIAHQHGRRPHGEAGDYAERDEEQQRQRRVVPQQKEIPMHALHGRRLFDQGLLRQSSFKGLKRRPMPFTD